VWRLDLAVPTSAVVPLLADDGWRAEVDGAPAPWKPRDGLVEVHVPAGQHTLRLAQKLLPEDVLGITVTGMAVLGLALWFRRGAGAWTERRA
jgi:hypothetical protein